ncbi:MAG: N-acetylmuramoyl-L-alanine amidase [Gemmatimonadota bacterium]|nr:N-acetylmuramoyl-L-alanine amidase [Gemmatimonadota bacterium]MDP7032327.1 N-acetylmuramoyl-L-alanine amidase [Gemmatimonadota bacterium]
MNRLASALLAAGCLALVVHAGTEASAGPRVERSGGFLRTTARPEPRELACFRVDGVDCLRLADVARIFHGTRYWRPDIEKIVLKVAGRRIRLTVDSPFVFTGSEGVNLMAPIVRTGDGVLVPVRLVTRVLSPIVEGEVSWHRDRRLLRIDTEDPTVLRVSYGLPEESVLAEIGLGKAQVARVHHVLEGSGDGTGRRVRVAIDDGILAPELEGFSPGGRFVDSLVATQRVGHAELDFHLSRDAPTGLGLEFRGRPARWLLAAGRADSGDAVEGWGEGERADLAGREVRVVAVDAGHGGMDRGVLSSAGVSEKEIALLIAGRLAELLEDEGFVVVMTRRDDRYIRADSRAEKVIAGRADLLFSIHANGWFDASTRGFSVAVLPEGTAAEEGGMRRWGEVSADAVRESRLLADWTLEEMEALLPLESRGVREGDFAVLRGAGIPAVLVECGFLSNPEESLTLSDGGFHDGVAVALLEAALRFRDAAAVGELQPAEETAP